MADIGPYHAATGALRVYIDGSATGGDSVAITSPIGTGLTATAVLGTIATDDVMVGSRTETAPATDTATSGLNGRLQRIAQRLTTLIAGFNLATVAGASIALGGTTSSASVPVVLSSDGPFAVQTGSVTETAPATDTASSGLNGRLQRLAQRLTTIIAGLNVIGSLVTMTERSSAITVGGTSQQLAAANASRKYLFIQNPYSGQAVTAENLYIRFGASAAGVDNGTAIELLPGASLTFDATAIPTQAIQVNAATTAHKFIAMEG